jgi:CRISPR-associated protein Cas1
MNLYIHSAGRLERDQNSLVYITAEGKKINIPAKTTDCIYLFGQTEFNTQTLWLLSKEKIPCHIFSWTDNHVCTITPHPEQISGILAIKQGQTFLNKEKRMLICREIIDSAAHNILTNCKNNSFKNTARIEKQREKIKECKDTEELMGVEGNIRKLYYENWEHWLGLNNPFKRKYNPPENPINTLVSFLNSLNYSATVSELYRTALHPGIAYLHEPQTRRYSLALDLSEVTKPILTDRLIGRLWNNNQIKDTDFLPHSNGVILKDEARKNIVKIWEENIQKTFYCRELKRNISYRGIIRRDCYKLIRYILENNELNLFKTNTA